MLPRAKLADHRAEDTGADRLLVLVDQHRGVAVEADHRAIRTADVLGGADDHRAVNVALLHAAARRGFLDGNDDDVADARRAALRAAQHLDALDALGSAVIRNVQVGLHLDHGSTLILSNSSQASASATSSALAFFDAFAGFFAAFSARCDGADAVGSARSGSAISTAPIFAAPMRSTTVHVFSFETGAHSSMRTISPARNSLAAS